LSVLRHNYIPSVIALTAHIPLPHKLFEPLILDVAFSRLADTPSLFTLKDCAKSMLLQIQF
jgi:hypothetical protein